MLEIFPYTTLKWFVTDTSAMNIRRSLSSKQRLKYFRDIIDSNESKFDKILVANRGEIACRIIKTAKEMRIKTVAVYSSAESNALHTRMADEAVCLGPPPIQESYSNINRILEVVKRLNIPAVHPGYGFLSENAAFVSILEKEGIAFIGPNSKTIASMGDKLESKRIARSAGVNTIPGYDGIVKNSEHCVQIARNIGYPVFIKACAGGGGKGMRLAHNDIEAREGFRLSTEEAECNFGDSRMIVEKYIEKPRHIEIQVLSDLFGNTIYLHERECSVQRRNQKIIEEAPSVFIDEITREKMGSQAVSLCKHIGYSSVGTVEFLVDKDRKFYFLEMNTRIQVEHPVTEFITGIDLVHQMIRIAKGHPLKFKQHDIPIEGWAIECRILAEDPYQHFGLPQTGRLFKYVEPIEPSETMVRCDSGVEEGSNISIYYDSMLSKLICYGKTRQKAIEKCLVALDSYIIRGVTHNIPLLRTILTEKKFLEGDINTCLLTDIYPEGFKRKPLNSSAKKILLAFAATVFCKVDERSYNFLNQTRKATNSKVPSVWKIVITLENEENNCSVEKLNDSYKIDLQNDIFLVKDNFTLASQVTKTIVNGEQVIVQIDSKNAVGHIQLIYEGAKYTFSVLSETASRLSKLLPKKCKNGVSNIISSPLPGIVKSVSCKPGDEVVEGQEICVIEAMKMQNSLSAPVSGRIKSVLVKTGDTVRENDILIQFE